ncbi:MAG: hypothetical protein ABIX00_06785 [Polaromonas sp.]
MIVYSGVADHPSDAQLVALVRERPFHGLSAASAAERRPARLGTFLMVKPVATG